MSHEPRHPDDRDDPAPEVPRYATKRRKEAKPWVMEVKAKKEDGIFGFYRDWSIRSRYATEARAQQALDQWSRDDYHRRTFEMRIRNTED